MVAAGEQDDVVLVQRYRLDLGMTKLPFETDLHLIVEDHL